MITGDLATDAWLARHGVDIAIAVFAIASVLLYLPGLLSVLAEKEDER